MRPSKSQQQNRPKETKLKKKKKKVKTLGKAFKLWQMPIKWIYKHAKKGEKTESLPSQFPGIYLQ